MKIKVVGGGLAGSEAAYYLAQSGYDVELWDIKPSRFTPAHSDKNFGELVCSNSLKGNDPLSNACGLLKEEMRTIGSLTMQAAEYARIPAGGALAVDRGKFAQYITEKLTSHPHISIVCGEVKEVPEAPCIVATGPLTTDALSASIGHMLGANLHFYDASAPIVSRESVDMRHAFFGDRYGKGGDDYLNCPMDRETYTRFVRELVGAGRALLHEFDKGEIFEGCMPVEVMASRGEDTLRYGPFKPVGLRDGQGNRFYAVLQLRKENAYGSAYNLVGCQTNLKFGEQKRVFSIIPALSNAEFLRYGVMHRNTFINSPQSLEADFSLKGNPLVFFAGQMTGVEGYVESAASGLMAAVHMVRKLNGKQAIIPPATTVLGALSAHISTPNVNFQPMNANFGILNSGGLNIRDKKQRYAATANRALADIREYKEKLCQ